MDFPVVLTENPSYVYSVEELKQNVICLLKNQVGFFIQGLDVGSSVSVHSQDTVTVEEAVRKTLTQIPYIKILQIRVNLPLIEVNIEYNSEIIRFQYSIEV